MVRHNHATPAGPVVVKYGGAALDARVIPSAVEGPPPDQLLAEIAALQARGTEVVLVHGGGPEIDRALQERGVGTERVEGQRVTDATTLEIAEAVLCGTLNKRLVRACTALGMKAAGISGEDARTLVARRATASDGSDLGFVGEIISCDPTLVRALLERKILPVIAPLAVAEDSTHAYNVNADLAAASIAAALRASAFIVVTNVPRVLRNLDDPDSAVDHFSPDEALAFAATDACRSSMKPKLVAAATAVRNGAAASYVCSPKEQTIASALAGDATIVT